MIRDDYSYGRVSSPQLSFYLYCKSTACDSQGNVHPERFKSYLKQVNMLIDINKLYVWICSVRKDELNFEYKN